MFYLPFGRSTSLVEPDFLYHKNLPLRRTFAINFKSRKVLGEKHAALLGLVHTILGLR